MASSFAITTAVGSLVTAEVPEAWGTPESTDPTRVRMPTGHTRVASKRRRHLPAVGPPQAGAI
jgi:hypothetical protein